MESGSDTTRKITLGHITGVFGVKGWLKVHSDTHPRENIVTFSNWYLNDGNSSTAADDQGVAMELESGRPQGKTIIAKLKGIDTPEQARTLIGQIISVNRSDLPPLEPDEYYWADIIGFDVKNTEGQLLGGVDRLFETGANDVVVVKRRSGQDKASAQNGAGAEHSTEILIPWVMDSVVLKVDTAERLIIVDWDPDY